MNALSQKEQILPFPLKMVTRVEKRLGYHFRDPLLLRRALTHRSYVYEHEDLLLPHNEALEFLGDSVLGFLVSTRIFRRGPELTEGDLSRVRAHLVNATYLAQLAEKLELGSFILLSRGEEKTGGRTKRAILADAFEAVLGAVYLDGGVEAAGSYLERQLGNRLEDIDLRQMSGSDSKSALQERLHNLGLPEPLYRLAGESGPDHCKVFSMQVVVNGEVLATATGSSKKEAQQAAARLALQNLA